MRVLIVGINYAPEPTGIAPYTAGLAAGLARAGEQVRVITGYPHYPQWRVQEGFTGMTREETLDGVRVRRVRHFVPRDPGLVDRAVMELIFGVRATLSRWGRADTVVLVTPALFSTGIALIKARLLRKRCIVWVQDIYSAGIAETGMGGGVAGRILRAIERTTLRSADEVVVIHERFKRQLVDELGVDGARITVVRNWAHIRDVDGSSRDEVRARRGWRADDVVVLHAGNIGAKQGLENVVAASQLAESTGSAVRFVMLGDGNQRASLLALGTNSRLEYIEPLPDEEFRATLGAADILLVNERPGLKEMCVPSKLTSYFSTGLPVIASTDDGSITAEELTNAGAGPRVDAGDAAALLAAAEELGSSAARRTELGEAGRRFKREHLAEDTAIAGFRTVLR
jgi:Glycosyltransferase